MATEVKTIFSHDVLSSHPSDSPADGSLFQYALADGFYQKNSAGVVTKITSSSGIDNSIINAIIFG